MPKNKLLTLRHVETKPTQQVALIVMSIRVYGLFTLEYYSGYPAYRLPRLPWLRISASVNRALAMDLAKRVTLHICTLDNQENYL